MLLVYKDRDICYNGSHNRQGGVKVLDDEKRRHRRFLRPLGLVLLALLCIAGVELAACRVMEPELYQRLTHPAAELIRRIGEEGQALVARVEDTAGSLWKQKHSAPVSQAIQEPSAPEEPLIQDPAATQFARIGGQEVLTGGLVDLVYFNQGEEPWADAHFGPDPIRGYGCGPTAMSMVVSTLGTKVVDPAEMAQIASEEGYCAPGSGSYLSIVQGLAADFGLNVEPCYGVSAEELRQLLASGDLLVALMGPGHFTDGGHFIVLRGVTLTGQVLVADPNSRERSLSLWEAQLILDELSQSRSDGAPLWCFSPLNQ